MSDLGKRQHEDNKDELLVVQAQEKRKKQRKDDDETQGLTVYVRCPLCPKRTQKRFTQGRSIRMHLSQKHADGVEDVNAFVAEMSDKAEVIEEAVSVKRKGKMPWVECAQKDDLEGLEKLQKLGKWDWDTKDHHGSTAEQYAAGAGAMKCLKYCLKRRFETCEYHREIGFEQDDNGKPDISKKCSCEPELSRRKDGRNALHWASRNGRMEVVNFLVNRCGMDLEAKTFDGTTPLMYAVFGGQLPVAKRLVELGANPKCENDWACDLTHWVAISRSNDAAALKAICSWIKETIGLSFTREQKEGRTPLHKAVFINNTSVVEWLVSNLEEVSLLKCFQPDVGGQKPSDLARIAGHLDLVQTMEALENTMEVKK